MPGPVEQDRWICDASGLCCYGTSTFRICNIQTVTGRCSRRMRSDIAVGARAGGKWYYNGFNSTTPAGPFNQTPAVPLYGNISVNGYIPWGDNFEVDHKNKTEGFYKATYVDPLGNTYEVTIQIINNAKCVGADVTAEYSENDLATYNLFDLIDDLECPGPTGGGTWTDLDGAGAGFSNGLITPSDIVNGSYRFKYSLLPSGFIDLGGCADCKDVEVTITVEIIGGLDVMISEADDTCLRSLEIRHPDTNTLNSVEVIVTPVTKDYITFRYKTNVTTACGLATVVSDLKSFTPPFVLTTFVSTSGGDPLLHGGWIESIRLHEGSGGIVDVPCAPSGANIARLTGSEGTVNSSQLILNASNKSIFESAISTVILNYLNDVRGVDPYFNLHSFKFCTYNLDTQAFTVYFGVKHDAENKFMGIDKDNTQIVYNADGANPQTSTSSGVFGNLDNYFYADAEVVPCPVGANKLKYYSEYTDPLIDDANTNYNLITLVSSTASITPDNNDPETKLSHACPSKALSAVVNGCDGTATYAWSSGEITPSVEKLIGSGSYTVVVDCDNPVDTTQDTVII